MLTSFCAIDCTLPNEFIKTLCIKLPSDLANSRLSCLTLLQLLIKLLLQIYDIQSGSWSGWNSLTPQLTVFLPLTGRQNAVQDLFRLRPTSMLNDRVCFEFMMIGRSQGYSKTDILLSKVPIKNPPLFRVHSVRWVRYWLANFFVGGPKALSL